jgi:hypothetical protein
MQEPINTSATSKNRNFDALVIIARFYDGNEKFDKPPSCVFDAIPGARVHG